MLRLYTFQIQFIIISDPGNDCEESKISDIILEVIVKTDIYKRFDTSQPFWDNFNARKPERQKKTRLVRTVTCQ